MKIYVRTRKSTFYPGIDIKLEAISQGYLVKLRKGLDHE